MNRKGIASSISPVFTLGILSDAHIGYPSDGRVGEQSLQHAVEGLDAARVKLAFDLGDASDTAQGWQLDRYQRQVDRLQAPLHVIPGNHDRPRDAQPADPSGPDRGVGEAFLGRFGLQPRSYDLGALHLVTLDNSSGRLGESQMNWLARDLAAHPGSTKVVALHEPPFYPSPKLIDWLSNRFPARVGNMKMVDRQEVARFHRLLVAHGVQQVISGHTHHAWQTVKDGVTYTVLPAVGGITRPGYRHGFGLLEFDGHGVQVKPVWTSPPIGLWQWLRINVPYLLRGVRKP